MPTGQFYGIVHKSKNRVQAIQKPPYRRLLIIEFCSTLKIFQLFRHCPPKFRRAKFWRDVPKSLRDLVSVYRVQTPN